MLDKLGISWRTLFRRHGRFLGGGPGALENKVSALCLVYIRILVAIHDQMIEQALE